jgi:hypothetical protein
MSATRRGISHAICTGPHNGPPSRGGYYNAMAAQELVPRQARNRVRSVILDRGDAGFLWVYYNRKFAPVQIMDQGE